MSGPASFNFDKMLQGLENYVKGVKSYLSKLEESKSGSSVNLTTMFQLQFRMQIMSQYIEAVSNTLSAVHQEMMAMARAVSGK